MEKYKEYREEIAKSSKLGYSISMDNQNIEKYKHEINKINPSILTSMADQTMSLHKGVTEVTIGKKEVPVEISKLFSTLNKAKNTINQENVNTIFFNLQNNSILDKQHNVKNEWLAQNPDYIALVNMTKDMKLDEKPDQQLEKSLETRYNDFTKQPKPILVANAHQLVAEDTKQTGHHIFVISVSVAILFFVIVFALIITRMALL